MSRIVLTSLNARYIHSALGLRSLKANLGELRKDSEIMEFVIGERPADVAERILARKPRIVGIGVSIWNALESAQLLRIIKAVSPETYVVLGGPEVSHEPLRVDFSQADFVVAGEGELTFPALCRDLLGGRLPPTRRLKGEIPDPKQLALPYDEYTDEDVRNRVVYLEASRGCPFACEFCLSSIDRSVRYFPLADVLKAMDRLWRRGLRHFKFVDRSFNIDQQTATSLLDFFLDKEPPYMVHFEMVPTILTDSLRERLVRFLPGTLQLELGIQTLNADVAARIGRVLEPERLRDNLTFLSHETRAHLHLDLIFGLPGESMDSMAEGLDQLMQMARGEIQLGLLKKLAGTAIGRHGGPFSMVFSPFPPYEVLRTNRLSFAELQSLKRMARFWDLFYNSGRFRHTLPLLWPEGKVFDAFFAFSVWLYQHLGATSAIAQNRLQESLHHYLVVERGLSQAEVDACLQKDQLERGLKNRAAKKNLPSRQERHRS